MAGVRLNSSKKRHFRAKSKISDTTGALLKESDVTRNTDVVSQKRIYSNKEIRNEIPNRNYPMKL